MTPSLPDKRKDDERHMWRERAMTAEAALVAIEEGTYTTVEAAAARAHSAAQHCRLVQQQYADAKSEGDQRG